MSEPLVTLDQVTVDFGGKLALHEASLVVQPAEIVSFVGPNGSGKSTCLRVMIGLAFRESGKVSVCGMDPRKRAVAIRRRSCYLPGETSLYPMMTGHELLRFAHSGYARRDEELTERMLEAFDLPLDRRVHTYSAGMKQKLALLVALAPDVDLYLLDEPDRNLDGATQAFLRSAVDHLRQRRKTVIFSSHQLAEIGEVADRLIFMSNGRVIEDEQVSATRAELQREVRILLDDPTADLPAGGELIGEEADGWIRVRTADSPVAWLASLDPSLVRGVEIGSAKTDLLYRRLTRDSEATR